MRRLRYCVAHPLTGRYVQGTLMMRYTVFVAFISIFVAGCVGFHASPESRLIHNSSMMTERIQGALNQQGEYVGLDVRVNFKLDDKAQVSGF